MRAFSKAGLLVAPFLASAIDIKASLSKDNISLKDISTVHVSTGSDDGSIINFPAGVIGDSAAANIKILANKNQSPDDEPLEFHVEILSSEKTCEYGNVLVNGEKLAQESKDGITSGRGSITSGFSSPIIASWNFECLTLNDQEVAQLLKFNVEDIAGKSIENIGFALSFKQTGTTEIIRIESGASYEATTNWLQTGGHNHKHEEFQEEEEFPEFNLQEEIMELEYLRADLAHLIGLIDQKERALEEHRMSNDNKMTVDDIRKCDSLKCIMHLTLEKARGAAHVVYEKIAREGFFEDFHGRRYGLHSHPPQHYEKKHHAKPPHGGSFNGPKNPHPHRNSTHPPPPRFDAPGKHHRPPPPPPHGKHGGHGPPGEHQGPPPPHHGPPPPHHGPPSFDFDDSFDRGDSPPHHYHGPPPPFDDEEFYGPPHRHHGPPPPFDDEEDFHRPPHQQGPPPPLFDHEDRPHHGYGPPPPPDVEEDKPQHPFSSEHPDSKPADAFAPPSTPLEFLVEEIKPDEATLPPPPPMDHHRGPPGGFEGGPGGPRRPHGPHKSPLHFFLHFLKFLVGGFMFSILLLTLHRRHLANARRANYRPNAISRFFAARFGLDNHDQVDGDEEEKTGLVMGSEDVETNVDSELQQLRNAASVVGDIIAAEEGRFTPSTASSSSSQTVASEVPASQFAHVQHFARMDSLPGYRPGMGMGMGMSMTGIEGEGEDIELPAYEDNDGSEAASIVQDGFGYRGPGSEYAPSGSETSSLHEVLGAPKN